MVSSFRSAACITAREWHSSCDTRHLVIPPDITDSLQRRLLTECSISPYNYAQFTEAVEESAEVVNKALPAQLKGRIRSVMTSDIGFIQISGIPQDPDLMQTPIDDNSIESGKSTFVKERFAMAMSHLLGLEIFNYAQEGWGQGKLIFNIFPRKDMVDIKGAGGTRQNFGFHTENAWHPTSINGLFLVGMRPDHERKAQTYATAVSDIVSHLSDREISILSKERFTIHPPEIHRRMEREKGIPFTATEYYEGPVLTVSDDNHPELRVNFNGMKPVSDNQEHSEALDQVERLAQRLASVVTLNPDNMIVLNNKRSIHTRNGYEPRFDGNDRWFQRYFMAKREVLWKNQPVEPLDFENVLGRDAAECLIGVLTAQNILDDKGRVTSLFTPYASGYSLSLPEAYKHLEFEIRKILIKKGPSFPNRVV